MTSPAITDLDELYPMALAVVMGERKASTSYLQRKLQIGYNKAAALIERMEKEGLVSAASPTGVREVLKPAPVDIDTGKAAQAYAGVEPLPAAAPPKPAPKPAPTGPLATFECSGCETTTRAAGDLPDGWYTQTSGKLGLLYRCPACAQKNAVRIATEHLTTEEILEGKSINADAAGIASDDVITGAAQGRLRTLIERCQRLLEDAAVVRNDLKEVLAEAKGEGFDVKIIRKLLTEMQKDKIKRQEEQALLDLYASAIGVDL